MLARVIERYATLLGMTIVVPSGNYGNRPFILGGIANVFNAITVGATTTQPHGFMASFSARGPGTLSILKPDISAPGDKMIVANSGKGSDGFTAQGTSYSSPVVAGAAAIVVSKCTECSAFAIKAILMNNARKTIKYRIGSSSEAPISLAGSGEVDIAKAVEASFWAYSEFDGQPSISLGVVDVSKNMEIRRTIEVTRMVDRCQEINAQAEFRSLMVQLSGAMTITTRSLSPTSSQQSCSEKMTMEVVFSIEASKVPSNYMTSGGLSSASAWTLDKNEIDGWITLSSTTGHDINIPFTGIFRKAADVTANKKRLPVDNNIFPADFAIGLENNGAGTAQMELYELLVVSEDDAEPNPKNGETTSPPADFKYIGFRTVEVDDTCGFILEFAFQLWERRQSLSNTEIQVSIDVNGDSTEDYVLANRGPRTNDIGTSDCRLKVAGGEWECTGFVADHPTNSATVIIRACSKDMGITSSGTIGVSFSSATYPRISQPHDSSAYMTINVPSTIASTATSFDIAPGAKLPKVLTDVNSIYNSYALGLLLFSNGYRGPGSTGAAVQSSEAIAIPFPSVVLPLEQTRDNLSFDNTPYKVGPGTGWNASTSKCPGSRALQAMSGLYNDTESKRPHNTKIDVKRNVKEICSEKTVPRLFLPTPPPSPSPTKHPSVSPTRHPSQLPSIPSTPPSPSPIQAVPNPNRSRPPSTVGVNNAFGTNRDGLNRSSTATTERISLRSSSSHHLTQHIGVLLFGIVGGFLHTMA